MFFPSTLFGGKDKVPYIQFDCIGGKFPKEQTDETPNSANTVSIAFPIPVDGIAFDHSLSWNEIELGTIAGAALNIIQSAEADENISVSGALTQAVGSAAKDEEGNINVLGVIAGKQLAKFGEKVTGLNLKAAEVVEISQRQKLAKNRNLQFGGASIRSFNFNFKLIPYTKEESEICKQICNFLTANAYGEIADNRLVVKYPAFWKIGIFDKDGEENKFMQKFDENGLQITKVDIKYNTGADVKAYHKDGAPAVIDVSIGFKERRGLYRADIEKLLPR
jgi:hypothetical protein